MADLEVFQFPQCPNCVTCKKLLTGDVALANGKLFHSTCFDCSKCDGVLQENFAGSINHPFCVECFVKEYPPLCGGCQKPFENGMCFELLGKHFHFECMTCFDCRGPFVDNQCYQITNTACCLECYTRRLSNGQ